MPNHVTHKVTRQIMSDSSTDYDVAILGGGFSGGLLAWVLSARGMRVLLVERDRFGRFAIGESSTPMADLVMRQLAERHGLPKLHALSTYPTWQRNFPELRRGMKRGFSYYHHGGVDSGEGVGREFHDECEASPSASRNSLLVTASPNETWADTHWLRSDVDAFFIEQAMDAGANCREHTEVVEAEMGRSVRMTLRERSAGDDDGTTRRVSARWIVNASGRFGVLPDSLMKSIGLRRVDDRLRTNTRSVFAHFRGVKSWTDELRRTNQLGADEPFDPDDAAQHHLTDEGWMWMLRLDHGVTSVGWTQPSGRDPVDWQRYPSLQRMMREAVFDDATPNWISVDRVQRMQLPVRSGNYIAMPTAVATIDPLHSTGIAHGLIGVARLADALLSESSRQSELLQRYAATVEQELMRIDSLVAMCYRCLRSMPRFEAVSMLYFAAAIGSEEFLVSGGDVHSPLWFCGVPEFERLIEQTNEQLDQNVTDAGLWEWLRPRLQSFQSAGLLDPGVRGRYRYTGEAKSSVRD
ncbi:NAD(P)/FAD-dependent oxidoreductase [Rhodopirellula bahusiensis]|nr:FAD-dependent oxidoreductase [Rhodopirellula bahusiensis]